MSTTRHRIPAQVVEHSFKRTSSSAIKKDDDHQDWRTSENTDVVNTYKKLHDILGEFKETLNEFGWKTEDLEKQLALIKQFPQSKLASSDSRKRASRDKSDKLPEREFTFVESPLTELFEIVHIKTARNIFIVSLILILMSSSVSDSMKTGIIHLGLETAVLCFKDFPGAFVVWLCMKISTIVVFYGVQYWSTQYQTNNQKTLSSKLRNLQYLISLFAYCALFMYLPVKTVLYYKYSIPLNFALLMEQIRMTMKLYAFVRTNVAKVKSGKLAPDISKFIYFMFAPTLVYRDNYPRKSTTNWLSVIWYMVEVLFTILYTAFVFERMLLPLYRNFGIEPLNIKHLYLKIFSAMLPSTLMFVFGFYLLLHSWMNAWAEALRFGDRTFYKDWWNVTSYHHFYRTWNTVVHDWLYTYVYREVYENYFRNKSVSFVATVMASALVHEYIIAFSLGFFYPVLFITFGFSSILFVFVSQAIPEKMGNVLFWMTLCAGNGIVLSLYIIEGYARVNCPPFTNETYDLFVPRSLTMCY